MLWRGLYIQYIYIHIRVEDIARLAIFENGHYAADQVYLYTSSSKKYANLASLAQRTRGKVFIFKKITGIFKINIFSENTFKLLQRKIPKKEN